ncbi:hypothetical protein ES703_106026 [subsurface metagenome]
MNFLSMWQFWIGFAIGIFIGCIIGYFVAALCCISGRASRLEEKLEQSLMKDEDCK